MKKQNYHNHKMYYAPHHFVFLPLMAFLIVLSVIEAYKNPSDRLVWTLFGTVCFCIFYLAIMLRQHYALGNQNRIVRLEFRLRYFQIFGEDANEAENKLRFGQIAALRFAPNDEFVTLLNLALKENLSSSKIKQAITNWQADDMRV